MGCFIWLIREEYRLGEKTCVGMMMRDSDMIVADGFLLGICSCTYFMSRIERERVCVCFEQGFSKFSHRTFSLFYLIFVQESRKKNPTEVGGEGKGQTCFTILARRKKRPKRLVIFDSHAESQSPRICT